MTPQGFPVTGVVGLEGEVGDEGVELDPPPPQPKLVSRAIAMMAGARRIEAVRANI
jgi:hypothetical protein